MPLRLPMLLSYWLAWFPIGRASAFHEWELPLPDSLGLQGPPEFQAVLEAGNGDILLAGSDSGARLFVRASREGTPIGVHRNPYAGNQVHSSLGLYETTVGVISLWGCCGEPGWSAIRHDADGAERQRIQLGYPRGRFDVNREGRVVFLSNELVADQARRMPHSVEGRSLSGAASWKTALAPARQDEVFGALAVGENTLAILDRQGNLWGDTLKLWMFDAKGALVWQRDLPTGYKPPAMLDLHAVLWSHVSHRSGQHLVLSGMVGRAGSDDPPPDSVAVAAFDGSGNPIFLKRFAILGPGDPEIKVWQVAGLETTVDAIRVRLFHRGSVMRWRSLDISWGGEAQTGKVGIAGINFLLPTRDGGVIAGGRIWRRNGQDTVALAALKFSAAEAGSLRLKPDRHLPAARPTPGSHPFDAAGRSLPSLKRSVRGPSFILP